MKKEQKQERDANTLCIPYISLHPSLHALCMTVGRVFFFHQSSLYPIKIFAKCFYLLVCILFSAPYARAQKYDRLMIVHARDECAQHVLFSLTSFIVGTI